MTIRELIEHLSCYPADSRVTYRERGDDGDEFPLTFYTDIEHIEFNGKDEVRLS